MPHCAKWGCKHTSSECSSTTNIKYITPTQRMTKEIHHLKKQLKYVFKSVCMNDLVIKNNRTVELKRNRGRQRSVLWVDMNK